MNAPCLELREVSLPFGSVRNFTADFGCGLHLVVGPNGVGKTSLLNSIAGTLQPSAGRIAIAGRPAHERSANVVLVPGVSPAIPWIRAGLLLDFILSLYPQTRRDASDRAALLQGFGLAACLDEPLGVLSAGSAKKLLLTAALLAAPAVMLFDEPTNEVDAQSIEVFLAELSKVASTRTVLVTTHQADAFMRLAPTVLRLQTG